MFRELEMRAGSELVTIGGSCSNQNYVSDHLARGQIHALQRSANLHLDLMSRLIKGEFLSHICHTLMIS